MKDDKKRKIMLTLILIAILAVGAIGTYAFFLTQAGTNEQQKLTIQTGNLALTFEDNDDGLTEQMQIGNSYTKEFKIRNTGTETVMTNMIWSELQNTYIEESLSYTLQYKTSETEEWQNLETSHSNVPHSDTTEDYNLATNLNIPAGATYYYKLTITFNNLADVNQEADKTAMLNTKFKLGDEIDETLKYKNMIAIEHTYSDSGKVNGTAGKIWDHKDAITSVVFENVLSPKTNVAHTYDLSTRTDSGEVMAYLVPTEGDASKYTAYIQADGKIMANLDSSYMFYNFTNLQSITGLENLDTSNVTYMKSMFNGCNNLTELDVSNFNTNKVTHMGGMFSNCKKLTILDVKNFDTSNVTNMNTMFNGCENLANLDLSSFDTSNVTSMSTMFANCKNLLTLNLNNFNTRNVLDMTQMFINCTNLANIDVSGFNTGKVTNMHSMFSNCRSLTTLDVSNFDTSNVTNMSGIFNLCKKITDINVSNFNTGNVINMGSMFSSCESLTTLDVSNFDTSKVTNVDSMFSDCSNLTSLNISNFNTTSVSNYLAMFQHIPSTIKITVGNTTLRDWCINASDSPKLTTSNFTIE